MTLPMEKFTVLMSVYNGDHVDYFKDALDSVIISSSLRPSQLVLVVDGPITNDLNDVILSYAESLDVIRLEHNIGLSNALNVGLKHCTYEIVFRMDADDISAPDRFEKQLRFLQENPDVGMCSSWVAHYDEAMDTYIGDRKLPDSPYKNKKYSLTRTPINHPAVAFRKSLVLSVEGYPDTRLPFEDWWLSLRIIKNGFHIYNIQEHLVNVRASKGFHTRRSGVRYLINEYKALALMTKEGVLPLRWSVFNSVIRTPFRLLPKSILDTVYRKVIRRFF